MEEHAADGAADPYQHPGRLGMEAKQSVQGYIAIKGTKNGLLLTLEPETPFSELLDALAKRLADAPAFFRGASLTVDTSRRSLRVSERVQLEDLLAYYQMSMMPVERAANPHVTLQLEPRSPLAPEATETREARETRDLRETRERREGREARATRDLKELPESLIPGTPRPTIALSPGDTLSDMTAITGELEMPLRERDPRDRDDTLFLRRTIRSGQAVHHHSSIVVLGDINPGAEIVAGGDIIVWGVLRGLVHAGYPDNEQALVCALHLAPVQLRIAHLLSRPPEGFGAQPHPEVASIRQGQIVVETWMNGRPPRR
jgi:septum site-determining protein MinC